MDITFECEEYSGISLWKETEALVIDLDIGDVYDGGGSCFILFEPGEYCKDKKQALLDLAKRMRDDLNKIIEGDTNESL